MALCSDKDLNDIIQTMQAGGEPPLARIEALIAAHDEDARLHFLRGSVLIGLSRHIEAHGELTRAVQLAPDFHLARFQLGFFELTSGEAQNALETWAPLDRLPDAHFLRKFVGGLRSLIADQFEAAITQLRAGIALNHENLPLNRDMQLIIERCLAIVAQDEAGAVSETSLILGHSGQGGVH